MFSKKYGFVDKQIQIKSMDSKLRNRIWTTFYKEAYDPYDSYDPVMTDIEQIMSEFGIPFIIEQFRKDREPNLTKLKNYFDKMQWYEIYDFLETYIGHVISREKREDFIININRILTEENAGYRIVGLEIAPIINEEQIKEIEKTIFSPYEPVERHMKKALSLYADRSKPDYENSIKESISAVESICCIITKETKATLGEAIKKLQENGVTIHKAMITAFEKLYGYTSDQNGIRHGGIDFVNATEEDARYMLISCSAFINYLTAKM